MMLTHEDISGGYKGHVLPFCVAEHGFSMFETLYKYTHSAEWCAIRNADNCMI
jgi:hypothetical protein